MAPVWVTTLQVSHYTTRHNVVWKCKSTLITYTIKNKDELEISLLISIRKHNHIYCNYEPVNKRGSIIKSINSLSSISGVPRNFVRGGGQQIQLRTEDRENGDLGAVAP